jgi:putative colanic acid biosynthesis acetyltransferase WcaF
MSKFKKFKYIDNISFKNRVLRVLWFFTNIIFFKFTPNIGFFYTWRKFVLIFFGAKIGSNVKISSRCIIWAPWNITIGDYSAIDDYVYLYSIDKITVGSKVAISRGSFIATGSHEIYSLKRKLNTKPIIVKNHAWIAAECFIHPGTIIGQGCVISARSVIKKNTKDWYIYEGNPAKIMKKRIIRK